MTKEIYLKNKKIQYDLQHKKVKNINLRINPDGAIHVSANRHVSQWKVIDEYAKNTPFCYVKLKRMINLIKFNPYFKGKYKAGWVEFVISFL